MKATPTLTALVCAFGVMFTAHAAEACDDATDAFGFPIDSSATVDQDYETIDVSFEE